MRIADSFDNPPAMQIQTGQQRYCAQPFVFVISQVAGMPASHWRPVWCRQSLNAGFLVIRDRHHAELPPRLAPPMLINDFDLLVNCSTIAILASKAGSRHST